MNFSASIRCTNFNVGAVKAGYLLRDYLDGKIQLGEGDEPYRDTRANAAYSDTIKQLMSEEPLRENIVLRGTRERSTVVSGGRTLATILHHLGGMPNIERTSQYDQEPCQPWSFAQVREIEVVVSLVCGE